MNRQNLLKLEASSDVREDPERLVAYFYARHMGCDDCPFKVDCPDDGTECSDVLYKKLKEGENE